MTAFHTMPASEVTLASDYRVFASRRTLLGATGGWALLTMGGMPARAWGQDKLSRLAPVRSTVAGAITDQKLTDWKDATTYNNFYEFGTQKDEPATNAQAMRLAPWSVRIEGLVKKPMSLALEDIMKLGAMEERIYRLRCVEGWSMVIPWLGFSLSRLIDKVAPLPGAKYVEFVTLKEPSIMPGVGTKVLEWPYVEGLRMDEAMHPLCMLAFGMYGQALPKQNGAPLRLVVPWKYGFKSAKSLVAIRFVERQPRTAWSLAAPSEYGFYSNVNPDVPHPRWSQATERRIGRDGLFAPRMKTQLFNGYAEQVASLYSGLDLRKYF